VPRQPPLLNEAEKAIEARFVEQRILLGRAPAAEPGPVLRIGDRLLLPEGPHAAVAKIALTTEGGSSAPVRQNLQHHDPWHEIIGTSKGKTIVAVAFIDADGRVLWEGDRVEELTWSRTTGGPELSHPLPAWVESLATTKGGTVVQGWSRSAFLAEPHQYRDEDELVLFDAAGQQAAKLTLT